MSKNLDDYKKKRDLHQSSEPSGEEKISASKEQQFVIQKHDASTLHYDFRLQLDDRLLSWAVPKGPSTDPSEKRLAIRTEDHPLAYANFEGQIEEGNYGAGIVLIWDKGHFENIRAQKESPTSLQTSLEEGKIEVWLHGEKIQGGYVLIRTQKGEEEKWLLKKMKDEKADARRKPTNTEPKSVVSGDSLEDIEEETHD